MTFPYPILNWGQTVTILNRYVSGQDDYGNDVYSYTPQQVSNCSVQQASTRENLQFTDQVTTGIIVFVPYGTQVGYLDAVVVNGVTYEVTGNPTSWVSPWTGHTAPIRIQATVVEGASALCLVPNLP
jgi:hypothetical protein